MPNDALKAAPQQPSETKDQIPAQPNDGDQVYKGLLETAKKPDGNLQAEIKRMLEQNNLQRPKDKQIPLDTLDAQEKIAAAAGKIKNIADRSTNTEVEIRDEFDFLKQQIQNPGKVERKLFNESFNEKSFTEAQKKEDMRTAMGYPKVVDLRREVNMAQTDWMSRIDGKAALSIFGGIILATSSIASISAGNADTSIMLASGSLLSFNYFKNSISPQTSFDAGEIKKMAKEYGVLPEYVEKTLLNPDNIAFYEMYLGKEDDSLPLVQQLKVLNKGFMNAINFSSFRDAVRQKPLSRSWDSMNNTEKNQWLQSFLQYGNNAKAFGFVSKLNTPEFQKIFEAPSGKNEGKSMYDSFYAMILKFDSMGIWDENRAAAFVGVGEKGAKEKRDPDVIHKLMYVKALESKSEK